MAYHHFHLGILLFLMVVDMLSAVKIDKLQVPEVIASDSLDAILECGYSEASPEDVTVVWLCNGEQVYEWSEGTEPKVSGVLEGRLDLTYRVTDEDGQAVEKRALRIVDLTPELSGEYTCVVRSRGREAMETRSMTVFSPERDFEITLSAGREPGVVDIKCVARRLHPRPDLILEYNKVPIAQQQQRTWREGQYFDVECSASVPRRALRPGTGAELSCRLHMSQVDYTAITNKHLLFDNHVNGGNRYPVNSVVRRRFSYCFSVNMTTYEILR